MKAQDTFKFLTSFMSDLTPVIAANRGFVDKYLGDGILAIFDAEKTFLASDAIKCGVDLIDAVRSHNEKHRSASRPEHRVGKEERTAIEVGIGINYGRVMLGAIGTSQRINSPFWVMLLILHLVYKSLRSILEFR